MTFHWRGYKPRILKKNTNQEWQGDGTLKEGGGEGREGEKGRGPALILHQYCGYHPYYQLDLKQFSIGKVPFMSWSRTWKANHSIEGCCINVDPWRVFAVLPSKMYRPKFGFFSHFGQRGSWRLKKMVLNADKWGWIDQCRGIWHNQVSDDDNEGKLWYQTSWWRWR